MIPKNKTYFALDVKNNKELTPISLTMQETSPMKITINSRDLEVTPAMRQIQSSLAQLLLDNEKRKKLLAVHDPEKICQLLNLAIGFRKSPQIRDLHNDFKQSTPSSNEYIINYLAEWAILEVSRKRYEKGCI